jgi:NTE family protein
VKEQSAGGSKQEAGKVCRLVPASCSLLPADYDMADEPPKMDRPRIGLALSGGAARGITHVGVLRALEENAIPIDAIAGASAGALIGGAYAAGLSIAQLEAMARKFRWRHMSRFSFSRLGLQSNAPMEKFLHTHLPTTRFEQLRIPFAAMVTDLHTGTLVVMRDTGDLAFAIRASTCIPGLYVPARDGDGRQLVDGGLVANLPIRQTRQLGADIVIGVDLNADGATFFDKPRTVLGVMARTFVAVERVVSHQERAEAELIIVPMIGHIRWDETRRAEDLLKIGYETALESIDQIKDLIEQKTLLLNSAA